MSESSQLQSTHGQILKISVSELSACLDAIAIKSSFLKVLGFPIVSRASLPLP